MLGISSSGATETILTGVRTPAAFGVDTERQQMLVPLVRENRVAVCAARLRHGGRETGGPSDWS